jgi:hypothetical protein
LPSVAVASVLVLTLASSAPAPAPVLVPRDLFSWDVGTRCCTIVLLTANLKLGAEAPEGVDSEMRAFRTEF